MATAQPPSKLSTCPSRGRFSPVLLSTSVHWVLPTAQPTPPASTCQCSSTARARPDIAPQARGSLAQPLIPVYPCALLVPMVVALHQRRAPASRAGRGRIAPWIAVAINTRCVLPTSRPPPMPARRYVVRASTTPWAVAASLACRASLVTRVGVECAHPASAMVTGMPAEDCATRRPVPAFVSTTRRAPRVQSVCPTFMARPSTAACATHKPPSTHVWRCSCPAAGWALVSPRAISPTLLPPGSFVPPTPLSSP